MPVFKKGSFSINLGFVSVGGDFDEQDRQCAWELYTEIITRVAVRGKVNRAGRDEFTGEIFAESLNSLYTFFQEARAIMKRYPVGRIGTTHQDHLGFFIARTLEIVIRPFLECWQASYRYWWQQQADRETHPFARQQHYPHLEKMLEDWSAVRRFCREAAQELAKTYALVDVLGAVPPEVREQWLQEEAEITKEV